MLRRDEMLCFSLGVAMRRVSKLYAEALAQFDITPPQLFLLTCLEMDDGQKPRDLAEMVSLDSSSMTPLLDRTEAAGLLVRRPDPDDRRSLRIFLTDKGRELSAKLEPVVEQLQDRIHREFFADYSPDQVQLFKEMLTRVRE